MSERQEACPKCKAESHPNNPEFVWACGSSKHDKFGIGVECQLRCASQQITELQAKLEAVDTFLESAIAGPRGTADPGWEGDVRFGCRITDEARKLQEFLHPTPSPEAK